FLFPHWESRELENYMAKMLEANLSYLQKIVDSLSGIPVSVLDYKLARKDVYVSSANLSAAFQRMLSEPKSKQLDSSKVHQFVVLNHILFSNVATVALSLLNKEKPANAQQLLQTARRCAEVLNETATKFTGNGKKAGTIYRRKMEVQ